MSWNWERATDNFKKRHYYQYTLPPLKYMTKNSQFNTICYGIN